MLLSFFLRSGNGFSVEGIIWTAAFVLWIPQLFVVYHNIRNRESAAVGFIAQIGALLLPFVWLGVGLGSVGIVLLMIALYADVNWGAWGLTLVFPTIIGLIVAVGNALAALWSKKSRLSVSSLYRKSKGLIYYLVAVIFIGWLVSRRINRRPQSTTNPTITDSVVESAPTITDTVGWSRPDGVQAIQQQSDFYSDSVEPSAKKEDAW